MLGDAVFFIEQAQNVELYCVLTFTVRTASCQYVELFARYCFGQRLFILFGTEMWEQIVNIEYRIVVILTDHYFDFFAIGLDDYTVQCERCGICGCHRSSAF